jgi:hypothetical protein
MTINKYKIPLGKTWKKIQFALWRGEKAGFLKAALSVK